MSKQELKKRTWTAVFISAAAGLLIAGTVDHVRGGLASGERFHIPLLVLLLDVVFVVVAIWQVIELLRVTRKRT